MGRSGQRRPGLCTERRTERKRDTIEAEAAEVLKKSGATPCTLYGIADRSPVVSSVEIGIKDGEDYMLLYPCARWGKVAEFKLLKMLPVYPECNGYLDVCNDEPACITKDSTAEDVEAWRAFNQRRAERYEQARQLAIANYRVYNEAMAQVCPGFKGSGPGYTQTSSVIRSGIHFTARYYKHEGTTFCMGLKHGTKATPDGFKLISANYYGKKGARTPKKGYRLPRRDRRGDRGGGYVASASTGRRLEEGTGRLPRVKRKRMRYS